VAGIGRVVLAWRERLLRLQPRGPGTLTTTLRYPYEVRQEYFEDIGGRKVAPAMLDITQGIIGRTRALRQSREMKRFGGHNCSLAQTAGR
jgi:DNA end-binding protein Ku